MSKIIGIDLGTTNSAVAIYDESGRAEILENLIGQRTTPSVVALTPAKTDKKTGEVTPAAWVVGEQARNRAAMNPMSTLYGVKRLIGRQFNDPEVAQMAKTVPYEIIQAPNGHAWVKVDGKPMSPQEISAKILAEIKRNVEEKLGETVDKAVITVPAYFNDAQRQATRDAGKIAGLDVLRIINEPTAAALAYGMDKKKEGKIAVFDLGGGTFDVSILNISVEGGSMIEVLSTNGDTFLGGENFDEVITEHLVNLLREETGVDIDLSDKAATTAHAQVIARLRQAAEKAKKDLSTETMTDISLPFLTRDDSGDMVSFEAKLTRRELEDLLRPLVERTLEPCRKALADKGLTAADIDEVILVGGQTRMPLVVETVRAFFGKEPRRDINPDEIVAQGAAVQGGVLSGAVNDVLLVDVTPLDIGIRAINDVMSVIVPRNATIPGTYKDVYTTADDDQREVGIEVYQGNRPKASDNRLLGQFTFDGLMPAKMSPDGKRPQVEVSFTLDENGMLEVTAVDARTKKQHSMRIDPNGGLSADDVERMRQEAEANAEADRLFREETELRATVGFEIRDASIDQQQDYYKTAPTDLQEAFNTAVQDLHDALAEKDVARMKDGLEKLNQARKALGQAFQTAAGPEETSAEEKDTPAATESTKNATESQKTTPPPPGV